MGNRRNSFLTFVAACIPGVGYMYLGLILKGIEALALYLLISPVFDTIGLNWLARILKIILWIYLFFDTYTLAHKLDRGETVPDTDFIFNRNSNGQVGAQPNFNFDENKWKALAWVLIVIGVFAVLNLTLSTLPFYSIIKEYISRFFIPALLILGGVFILVRKPKQQ